MMELPSPPVAPGRSASESTPARANQAASRWQIRCRHTYRTGVTLDVSLAVAGPVVGVVGPSGCGKSSLLHLLAGVLTAQEALVRFGEQTWVDKSQRVCLPPERRNIAMAFQQPRLFPHLSIRQNLLFGLDCRSQTRNSLRERRMLEQHPIVAALELGPLLERRPATLSGGQQQRVSLARAWLTPADVLLLDEPITHLDDRLAESVAQLIQARRDQGLPTWVAAHHRETVQSFANVLVRLEHGAVIDVSPGEMPSPSR